MGKQRNKIGIIQVIFVVISLNPLWASSQSVKYNDLILKIDTANFYRSKKIVHGLLENNSKLKIYYELGIELQFENKWDEIVGNLDFPNDKSIKIDFIKPHQIKKFSFKPSTIIDPLHHFRHLRFFIKYGSDFKNLKYKYSYNEFPLLPQAARLVVN